MQGLVFACFLLNMNSLSTYLNIIFSMLFPSICKSCEVLLSDNEECFCDICKKKLIYIEKPNYCYKCGISGEFKSYKKLCPICEYELNKKYKLMRTIIEYNNYIRPLVIDFKYKKGFDSADYIIKDIIRHYPKEYKNIKFDYITCVPTHFFKYIIRGFNHTEYISKKLSLILNIPFCNFVKKRRYTNSQTKLKNSNRLKNIRNSFALLNNKKYKNKNILIFEDVITTGSTLNEFIDVLIKTQANIYILVYADARNINTLLELKNGT